ncbi:monosaccharide ABC transporter substrate-binding protein, CUT2 family [Candidatus Koribacter versatilis Ellin345]|uniref:Monosaccharide ABC transporter substrate-binding protein, CUT2 family n=1 Tax=Koribacter versatilis (strain Ellin345) TaxID=204669 RepID=Q1IPZ7_KORVE|nr:substrate-binding domain-containing protein [Candidatus Koribacter versatilis]ABF41053.1 monosaccharide ABC transporter substrate-binding protein, CUT2 family [Candidatus Koribacter versatilis Ellin345]
MSKLWFVVSLPTLENDYQQHQANQAERTAARLGLRVTVIEAKNDSITQSLELLRFIQAKAERPNAIIVEPAGGTAFPQVAKAAVGNGIGWVVLNRAADYIPELRRGSNIPIFHLGPDHVEIGRMQGMQLGALLPRGGSVLYIEGPATSSSARKRYEGLLETMPPTVQLFRMRAHWTEDSSYKLVSRWLKLATSRDAGIQVVAAQDDSMAIGARKACEELFDEEARAAWLGLPFLGCDGVEETGQAWVREGKLRATVISPASTTLAIQMLLASLRDGVVQPEHSQTRPSSFPAAESLKPV